MKLFRKPRHDEKHHPSHHRSSSDPRVVRSQEQYQEHHRHKRHYQPQHPMAPNQYEYVRREHGFDFMPPSQYVPSRSLSEDTDDASVDPPIKIQVPGSDLSLSIVRSIDPHVDKRPKTPVVRGKPVRTRSSSRKKDRMENSHHQVLPASPQYRGSRQEHGGNHGKTKQYRSRQQRDDSSFYQRETTQIKSRTRSEPTNYRDSSSAVGRHSPREMAPPASRRGHSPDLAQVRYHGHEPRSVQHDRRGTRQDHRSSGEEYYQDDNGLYGSPPSIPNVPTAFSYQSEDSIENPQATIPRYGLSDEERGYLQITTAKAYTGRENGPTHLGRRDGTSRHHDNASRGVDLDALSTPTYDKKTIRRENDSVTGRIIIAPPIDSRLDTHRSRRRSRDVRDPMEVFEPPLGLEQPRHDDSDEFDVELSIGSYPDEVYYENPLMEQGYHGGHKRHQSTGRKRGDQKAKDRKKKSKGLLSRIRDTVLKEKGGKRDVERARDQDLREKGSLFENLAGSIDTDASSNPHYQHDARSTRAPVPRDENRYYEQPTRMPPRHVAPPPRTRSHRESFDRRQDRPVEYAYEEGPEIHQVQSSGKPFQTLRATTPTLRANPDNRQRYGGMNAATPKLYRSQVQGMGTSGHQRNHHHSPFLNYDPTPGTSHQPRRMRFNGC